MYFLLMWDMPKQLFLQSVSEALQQPCDLFRAMDSLACAILILPFYRIYIKNTANLKFYKIKNCKLNFLKPLKKHGKILVLIKNLIFILKNLQMARIQKNIYRERFWKMNFVRNSKLIQNKNSRLLDRFWEILILIILKLNCWAEAHVFHLLENLFKISSKRKNQAIF